MRAEDLEILREQMLAVIAAIARYVTPSARVPWTDAS
jgi:hypothetical protein